MADQNTSLPVRTESAGDIASKIVDALIPSQGLTVNADGSTNITDNGGSLTVDAVDLDVRDLAFATDKVDVSGSTVELGATSLTALESITVQNGAGASAVNIQDGGNSITVDGTVTANIRDAAGTAFSAVNPLPVSISADLVGDEINNHNAGAAIASGATSTHDYTVTALKTLLLSQVEASASGKLKTEVLVETGVATGVFVAKFVSFNSTATPNVSLMLKAPISAAAGVRVRVIRTNRDNQSMDVYSTISGVEV